MCIAWSLVLGHASGRCFCCFSLPELPYCCPRTSDRAATTSGVPSTAKYRYCCRAATAVVPVPGSTLHPRGCNLRSTIISIRSVYIYISSMMQQYTVQDKTPTMVIRNRLDLLFLRLFSYSSEASF